MTNFLFLVIGMLLMYLILQKPLKISVHHTHEDIKHPVDTVNVKELEQEMLKKDPVSDQLYADLDNILKETNDIMGGSDR